MSKKSAGGKKVQAKKPTPQKSTPKASKKSNKKIDVTKLPSTVSENIHVDLKNVRIGHESYVKGALVNSYMLKNLEDGKCVVTIDEGKYEGNVSSTTDTSVDPKKTTICFDVIQFLPN